MHFAKCTQWHVKTTTFSSKMKKNNKNSTQKKKFKCGGTKLKLMRNSIFLITNLLLNHVLLLCKYYQIIIFKYCQHLFYYFVYHINFWNTNPNGSIWRTTSRLGVQKLKFKEFQRFNFVLELPIVFLFRFNAILIMNFYVVHCYMTFIYYFWHLYNKHTL